MKLRDFGDSRSRDWFEQILQWSQKKITFADNVDGTELLVFISTTETELGHNLGRMPRAIYCIAKYPYGIESINFTKEPTIDKIFLSRAVAGYQWIRIE